MKLLLLLLVPRGQCYTINNFTGQQEVGDFNGRQDYFLSTQALSQTAVALNRYRLAELCKLKPNDYVTGLADSILKNVTAFERAKDRKRFHLTDLPLSLAVNPVPVPKQHTLSNITTTTTTTPTASNNTTAHRQGAVLSPRVQPVKFELASLPANHERSPNPMALGKVLFTKTDDRRSPATRPSLDDDSSNKRQRTERKVLPKPIHTVSSQHSQLTMIILLQVDKDKHF
ncbi:unnamed protein product [Absidia cylindrospora]